MFIFPLYHLDIAGSGNTTVWLFIEPYRILLLLTLAIWISSVSSKKQKNSDHFWKHKVETATLVAHFSFNCKGKTQMQRQGSWDLLLIFSPLL